MATKEQVFQFLDELKATNTISMLGARPYIMAEFDLPPARAGELLAEWWKTANQAVDMPMRGTHMIKEGDLF